MRYTCEECGARICTLKNLKVSRDRVNKVGEQLIVRGECSRCGHRYGFMPELVDTKFVKKNTRTYRSIMFGKYLAEKAE